MDNYYTLLGLEMGASPGEIKKAFRERAKRLHPDLVRHSAVALDAGLIDSGAAMRRLLAAWEVLSSPERRAEYDRALSRFLKSGSFDYRAFLKEEPDNAERQAKLIFFDLLHLEDDEAIRIWRRFGGINFAMEQYLDREDWLDCLFMLAEDLERRGDAFEAFVLYARIVREERRRPWFRNFILDIEVALKDIVRNRLRKTVDTETWIFCLETLLSLDFPPKDEARWLRSLAEALLLTGEPAEAANALREALRRDPALPNTHTLRRKLNIAG